MRTDTRVFPLRVPLRKSTHQYASKFREVALSLVREIYVGRCFRGCKIIEVIDIAKDDDGRDIITMPEYDNMRRDNTATYAVMVNARVLNLRQYDILHKCKVVSITPTRILCDWEHGSAVIKNNKVLQTIKIGQILPVRVGDKRFTYTKRMISVSAIPFIPIRSNQPTFVADNPSENDVAYINELFQNGLTFYNEVNTTPMFKTFADLVSISGCNIGTKKNETKETKEIKSVANCPIVTRSIESIIAEGVSFIGTRMGVDLPETPTVGIMKKQSNTVVSVHVKWVAAMSMIIDDWIDYVNDCHELSLVYGDGDMYEKSKNIWAIYESAKRSLIN